MGDILAMIDGGDDARAIALRDAWRERLAICTIDGELAMHDAKRVALDELRNQCRCGAMRTSAIQCDDIRSSTTEGR